MPDLALLTLTRTPRLFARLQDSLRGQQGDVPDTTGLVLNNATGADADAIKKLAGGWYDWKWLHCFYGENASFSRGNNGLAEVAVMHGATHLALVNDDVVMRPDTLHHLYRAVEAAPGTILGTVLLNSDDTVNHAGHDPRLPDPHVGRGASLEEVQRMGGGYSPRLAPSPCVTFAFAVVPVAVWHQLGGLDEGYVYGYEDTDMCMRARAAGYNCAVALDVVAYHDECGTRARGAAEDGANAARFRAKWADRMDLLEERL